VAHTVLERVVTDGGCGSIVMAQTGIFQLAPLPIEFVPRRLGFAKDSDSDCHDGALPAAAGAASASAAGASAAATGGVGGGVGGGGGHGVATNSVLEYVPVTRSSRLALPATLFTTTNFRHKADKKTIKGLTSGDIQGKYDFKKFPDDPDGQKKDCMRLVLCASSPEEAEGATHIHLTKESYAVLDESDGRWKRQSLVIYGTSGTARERFGNALTLDEKEYLVYRVLHLFLRAMASEIASFGCLNDAFATLEYYYSLKRYFEQTLDVHIIKADLDVGLVMATNHTDANDQEEDGKTTQLQRIETLKSLAECMEANVKFNQAGAVYAFIARSYDSLLMTFPYSYARAHWCAGKAFLNERDFSKSQEHMVSAWHALCPNDNSSRSTRDGRLDINGDLTTSIFDSVFNMYQIITEETSRRHGHRSTRQLCGTTAEEDREIVEVFPLLLGLLYVAGYQARNNDEISQARFLEMGSGIVQMGVFRGGLDQPSALNILIQAGARPNAKHFRQTILTSRKEGGASRASFTFYEEETPPEDTAKRVARKMQKQLKQRQQSVDYKTREVCDSCGILARPNGQPNFRCPCHKAAYCSKECQASHRKEHGKICTAPKKQK
jgi:MYND finger